MEEFKIQPPKDQINNLYLRMVAYEAGHPERIQHFVKVHSYAKVIGELEGATPQQQLIIETAALVHDIGIKIALNKHGSSRGELQEKLGPPEAEKLLNALNFNQPMIARVCYLVAHHHTYDNIEGLDYQILVEADFLVNCFEGSYDEKAIQQVNEEIFKTKTGKRLLQEMFQIPG